MASLASQLNPEQLRAVTHDGGPCLVLAGAGSGKTRVITHRLAWLIRERQLEPQQVCAVTFTNKAAAEMRGRIGDLLGGAPEALWLLTFHALGLRLLREVAGSDGAPRPGFAVYDRADTLAVWRRCQSELGVDARESPPNVLYETCSRARNRLEDPLAWDEAGRSWEQRAAAKVYGPYRTEMRRRNALDFDDLLVWPLELLTRQPELARRWRQRFEHLVVDEYQDTNRLQYRLVRALLGDDGNLMVVGDEDQSIYRWRGAELSNVLDFQRDFPGATVIRLEQNYRSSQPILAVAASLISHNRERLGKKLWSDLPGDEKPTFMLCGHERQEAVWIAKRLAEAVNSGTDPGELAILYRTNAQSRPFEEELAARRIVFRVVGGPTFFRRAEVKDLLAWLRLLIADDDQALARAAATPARGVGAATIAALQADGESALTVLLHALDTPDPEADLRSLGCSSRAIAGLLTLGQTVAALRARLQQLSLADLGAAVLEHSGYRGYLRTQQDGIDRLANVDELLASAAEFAADEPGSAELLAKFLDRAALISDADTARGARGVNLMTIHAAKGLEFETVFVTGLEEGLFPHAAAVRDGQVEEERRLAYVAMTRARKRLFLSAARMRRVHGQERFQRTSRFITDIDPGALDLQEDPTAVAMLANDPRLRTGYSRGRGGARRTSGARPTGRKTHGRPVDPNAKGTGTPAPFEALAVGAEVFHPKFGPGRIYNTQGSGATLKLTVTFTEVGTKQLVAKFAKLQLLA